jgi:hypothetical protein
MISSDKPVISFGARDIGKKMLKFLECPCSNTVGTRLVLNKLDREFIQVKRVNFLPVPLFNPRTEVIHFLEGCRCIDSFKEACVIFV